MAKKVEVTLVDDIDGGAADETLRFGLDGTNYEIDLSDKHATQLRAVLERYLAAARKVGRGGLPSAPRRTGGVPARNDRAQNQAIREWARRKKMELSDRGRIPRSIVEQYEAEAGR